MVHGFDKSKEYFPGERAGESLERELFGFVKNVDTIEKEREKVEKIAEKEKISGLEAAIIEMKERQIQNPVNPRQPFANFVRKFIIDELSDLKDGENLKFYTSVSDTQNKTVLDRDFGIDAFFELETRDKQLIVSIDLTNNPTKFSGKALLVQYIPDDFPTQARFENNKLVGLTDDEFKTFNKYADELAEKVAEKFKKLIALTKTPTNI